MSTNDVKPQGQYNLVTKHAGIVYTAGFTPRKNNELIMTGKIENSVELETYKHVVQQAVANALNAINSILEDEAIENILSMVVYINAGDDFTNHTKLADFASQYLYSQLGDKGICSRTAVGVNTLPGNAPIEIQITAAVQKLQ